MIVADPVFEGFLKTQLEQGLALAAESDILSLRPVEGEPALRRFVTRFRCRGLTRERDGTIRESSDFLVGITFPRDYLRRVDPAEVLTILHPLNIWHPNIMGPAVCVGHITPGMSLVNLLYQVFEILTYHKVTMREDDALNWDACVYARKHQHDFPIDRRALKRRRIDFTVDLLEKGGEG